MGLPASKRHNALKHAGFSAATILPGESAAEFEKLQQSLIAEFRPNGALEEETVASLAHLLWRKRNLSTFRLAELARQRVTEIQEAIISAGPNSEFDRVPMERTISKRLSRKTSALPKPKRAKSLESYIASLRSAMRRRYHP